MASLFLALIIVATNGPNFFFNSWHRVEFLSSTPWRSLRIRPASRRILKCCDKVDLGTFTGHWAKRPSSSWRSQPVPVLRRCEPARGRTGHTGYPARLFPPEMDGKVAAYKKAITA